jgi:predicted HD superfamily hydrolase involved in NAD metabolism
MIPIETIKVELKKSLSPYRYHHSLCVADLAEELGNKYGWNPETAYRAGLLHDCAKEWSPQQMISYVKKKRLKIPKLKFILKNSTNLMHAYIGAAYAKEQGWLTDKIALRAISAHTLGAKKMSLADKIIFVADFSSADRRHASSSEVRRVARKNFVQGFKLALYYKILSHLLKQKPIHPLVLKVWNEQAAS